MPNDFRWMPGCTTKLQVSGYNPYQLALWSAINDVYQARSFGYIHTLQPSPWFVVDVPRYEAWKDKFCSAHEDESHRDVNTRGWQVGDLPEAAWLYLFERMIRAEPLKPPPTIQYGSPWVARTSPFMPTPMLDAAREQLAEALARQIERQQLEALGGTPDPPESRAT